MGSWHESILGSHCRPGELHDLAADRDRTGTALLIVPPASRVVASAAMDTRSARTSEAMGADFSRVIATTTLMFTGGQGAELIAADGTPYLDFISGYGVTNTGHCHPHIVAAIQAQVETLMHVSTVGYTQPSIAYARRLCALAPIPDAKLFYTNSGTEAVEAALKLARYATGRPNILSFGGGFHGRTLGSLSVSTSKSAFRARHEPLLPGVHVVAYLRHDLDLTMTAIAQVFVKQSPALPPDYQWERSSEGRR